MTDDRLGIKGRGVASNPTNRFERLDYVADEWCDREDPKRPKTEFFKDISRSIVSYNNSPDINFDAGINPYRGCEHGCAYCYARPMHEYLGFSAGLDFETKIMVKENAAELLRKEMSSAKWKPQMLALCGATDAYQPIEQKLGITRACVEVLAAYRNPVAVTTKNHLVTRDIDLLKDLAAHDAVCVNLSIGSLDADLTRALEPRTSSPARRLAAVEALADAGIPVGVFLSPVIPGLNDHEIPRVVEAVARAGAKYAVHLLLRLPSAVGPLFESWLDVHYPNRKRKVLDRLREMRGGVLCEDRVGHRMGGSGVFAEQIAGLFEVSCRRAGVSRRMPQLSTSSFRRPGDTQMTLF